MSDFFKALVPYAAPLFVVATMLNVGLTQKLPDVLAHLKNWSFVLKMLIANFVLVPLLTIILLRLTSFDPALGAGLLLLGLSAGAPFLIKLTQTSENEVALGAAVMMLLVVVTAVYLPLALPLFLSGISVDALAVAWSLFTQMILPIIVGMLVARFLPGLAQEVQPWIGKFSNIILYVVIGATLIGYFSDMLSIVGTGAIFVGLAIVAGAFGIGYLMGGGKEHHQEVGGLGTAQRNTAAGLLVAIENFTNPDVLVMLTLANTLGLVMLLLIAKAIARYSKESAATV